MKYNYETISRCISKLGAKKTFTAEALDVLLAWGDSGDDVLFPMLELIDEPFTNKAIEFMEKAI